MTVHLLLALVLLLLYIRQENISKRQNTLSERLNLVNSRLDLHKNRLGETIEALNVQIEKSNREFRLDIKQGNVHSYHA